VDGRPDTGDVPSGLRAEETRSVEEKACRVPPESPSPDGAALQVVEIDFFLYGLICLPRYEDSVRLIVLLN
jgi:hypothetical protein